jgi:hypothetical protein
VLPETAAEDAMVVADRLRDTVTRLAADCGFPSQTQLFIGQHPSAAA